MKILSPGFWRGHGMSTGASDRADRLLSAYVLRQYRDEYKGHLAGCTEASVLEFDSRDGSYGCDTGCEYLSLQARIGCPHEDPVYYEYGEFGDIAFLVEQLIREEDRSGGT